jgi:hypothetical protein
MGGGKVTCFRYSSQSYLREGSEARPMRCIVLSQSSGLPSGPVGTAGRYLGTKSPHAIAGRWLA